MAPPTRHRCRSHGPGGSARASRRAARPGTLVGILSFLLAIAGGAPPALALGDPDETAASERSDMRMELTPEAGSLAGPEQSEPAPRGGRDGSPQAAVPAYLTTLSPDFDASTRHALPSALPPASQLSLLPQPRRADAPTQARDLTRRSDHSSPFRARFDAFGWTGSTKSDRLYARHLLRRTASGTPPVAEPGTFASQLSLSRRLAAGIELGIAWGTRSRIFELDGPDIDRQTIGAFLRIAPR